MCITLAGIVTNFNVVQEANALSPIVVTFSGITILYKALQKENAPLFNLARTRKTTTLQ